MRIFSIVLFFVAFFLSYDGLLIILGLSADIESGGYLVAIFMGLPLYIVGFIFGLVGVRKDKKKQTATKDKYLYIGVVINAIAIFFWFSMLVLFIYLDYS